MILVNGDSWTGGRHTKNQSVSIEYWPNYFEKITNIPITNLAFGGSSNQRIFRTTVDFLYNTTEPISHVIIGWSSIDRFELVTASGKSIFLTPSTTFGDQEVPDEIKKQFKLLYYTWCHNHQINLKNFLHLVLLMQDICRQKNIQLINFQSFNDNLSMVDSLGNKELTNLKNQIDMNFYVKKTMDYTTNQYPKVESGHVNEAGNQRWAEILIEKFNF